MMHCAYEDIRSRIKDPIRWHDERGVPRYDLFEPKMAADIYAREVALVEIECQECLERFKVAFSHGLMAIVDHVPYLSERIADDTLHYGDPPRHDECVGESMNCNDLRVLEFWWQNEQFEWERAPELEIGLWEEE